MRSKEVKLSASRLKTAKTCSWLYWAKYHMGLPDKKNQGASRGDICHCIFECLGKKTKVRKNYFKKIIKEKNPSIIPSIKRLIFQKAVGHGIEDEENLRLINDMILCGLEHDFFGQNLQKPTEAHSEYEFDIHVKEGEKDYKIKGYIDKLFLYKRGNKVIIRDFKTSKKVFAGDEVEKNLQDYIYCLAAKHMFPEYVNRESEFLFLKFDLQGEGYLKMEPISEEALEKFEHEMTQAQGYLEKFTAKRAKSSYAADKPMNGGFEGMIVCGFCKKPGELKKDGSPKWHCVYKFPFYYYALYDEKGKKKKVAMAEEYDSLLKKKKNGYEIKKEYYEGCPRWNRTSY